MSEPSALKKTGSTRAWRLLRARVLHEEPLCRWCRTRSSEHVDHIVPRERGGNDSRENLAGSCKPCNLARGSGSVPMVREPW